MTTRRTVGALLAALLLLPAAGAAAPAAVEPAAAAALTAALARIAAAKSFSFTAEITSDAPLATGEKLQFAGRLQVAVRRPDGLRVAFDGEPRSTRSWYDGTTFTHFDPGGNAYASCDAPASLEDLFPLMREQLGFTPPLSVLLHEEVVEEMLAGVQTGYAVGNAVIDGVATTHLAFRGDAADLQVWVSEGEAPVIKRMVVTRGNEPGAPQFAATFTAWDFAAAFGSGEFVFAAPPGAVQCEFLEPGK